ncbi:MAG: hypothetical protein PHQ86_02145 [Dehalococcoidales bacterium]|nr:hypothetical protein [Dehalococcoidales bacterium]
MSKRVFATKLLLVLIIIFTLSPLTPSAVTADDAKWSKVNIPTEGEAGDWVLANGSDVTQLTMAIDGTLYAYVKGLSYTLYKSTNEGKIGYILAKLQMP